jgi:serine/threonine protein kinase
MQRRSFSDNTVKAKSPTKVLPGQYPVPAIRNPSSKGKIRQSAHGSNFLSASPIITCCMVAALLCLTVQTKLYFATFPERRPALFSTNLPPAKKDNLQRDAHKHPATAEIFGSVDTVTNDGQKNRRHHPPRIFHYDPPSRSVKGWGLQHSKLLLTDDEMPNVKFQTQPSEDGQSEIDHHQMGNTSVNELDNEDGDVNMEEKDATSGEGGMQDCVPMAKWQASVPVNCNAMHEIDMLSSVVNAQSTVSKAILSSERKNSKGTDVPAMLHNIHHEAARHPTWNESQLQFLGQGWFRAAWRLDRQLPLKRDETSKEDNDGEEAGESIVLKMLRPERDFTDEFYELHRIDAVAMERLSHSKFVLNVYGYCGQSALNELANFRIPELSSLEKFDRQLRGKNSPQVDRMKLRLAIGVASGVAHIHEVPADLVTTDGKHATMAHYDLNPRNVAIVAGGMPKLNDFNVAHFLKWNPRTNATCGFESRLHEPWWRAPEEVSLNASQTLTEAVDVWSLGNLLHHILTTHSPRGKMKAYRMESVRQDVLRGLPPPLPKEFETSKDPVIVAFRQAMDMCFVANPDARFKAREVANVLLQAYNQLAKVKREKV